MAEVLDVKRRQVPIESLTLKLTGEEAEVLYALLQVVSGPASPPRDAAGRIYDALRGHEFARNYPIRITSSGVCFL